MEPHQIKYGAEETKHPRSDDPLTSQLYTDNAEKLLAYISRHIRSSIDAEDLLFEVFLAVIERQHDLMAMSEDEQRAWIWSVARHKMTDVYRRARRREHVPLEHVTEIQDDTWLPEQIAIHEEEHRLLNMQVQRLPALQQEILYLRFTGELRSAEIAAVLHKSETAIRKMLSRTLNSLRAIREQ